MIVKNKNYNCTIKTILIIFKPILTQIKQMESWVEVGNFTMKTGVCMQNCYIGSLTVKEKKKRLI